MGSWYTCADCDYMDLRDKNKYGEAYCSKRHHYYKISDTICNLSSIKGRDVGGSSNCYITTAICKILGFDDNCSFLTDLRNFREQHMKTNEQGTKLLEEYRLIGPSISYYLEDDENNKQVATYLLEKYIKIAINFINEGKIQEAIITYVNMTYELLDLYNLEMDNIPMQRKISLV